MRSQADKRRKRTPQHKRSARRRFSNKARLLLLVLGGLCLLIGVIMAASAFFRGHELQDVPWLISYAYLGVALVCLLLRALLGFTRKAKRQYHPSLSDE